MNGKKPSLVPGLILITLGIIIILHSTGVFRIDWDVIWTYVIIFLGVLFWLGFLLDRSDVGVLMPGSVLITVGLVLNYAARNGWYTMNYIWPFFILAPAFGFYAMFLLGNRDRGLLVPAGILTVIGVIFLLQSMDYSVRYAWAIGLIVIGALLLLRGLRGRDEESGPDRNGQEGGDS
jgi:hypothetical protein